MSAEEKQGTEEQRLIGNKKVPASSDDEQDKKHGLTLFHSMKGVILALLAGAFSAFNNTITAFLTKEGMPAYQLLTIMYGGGVCVIAPLVVIFHGVRSILADTNKQRILLVSIGIFYTAADTLQALALGLISIGNVTAIYRGTMPVITPVLAWIFLRKPYTKVQIVNTVLCVLGIIFTAQPTFIFSKPDNNVSDIDTRNEILGLIFSLFTGVGFSITYVMGSGIGDDVSVLVISLYENTIGALTNMVLMFTLTAWRGIWHFNGRTFGLLFGLILTFLCNFCSRFRSLQIEPPTTVVLLVNIQIVLAYLADYIFFDDIPNMYDIIGASLIIFSSGFVAIATSIQNVQRGHSD